jgi:hypothetical protein
VIESENEAETGNESAGAQIASVQEISSEASLAQSPTFAGSRTDLLPILLII